MKVNDGKRKINKKITRIIGLNVLIVGLLISMSGLAWSTGTPVGQVIQNQASATYVDVNNNGHTAQSNVATITVAQIYTAEIGEDRSINGAPGQSVNFPHTLRNTGNGTDTFTVDIAQDYSTADNNDFNSISVYLDANNNGIADGGETLIATVGTSGTIDLTADQQVSLVVQASIPGDATSNQVIGTTLTVTSTNCTVDDLTGSNGSDTLEETNENKVTVTSDAVLNVNKSSTYNDNGTTNDISDDTITYTVTLTNTGQGSAYNVELRDALDLSKFNITDTGDITIDSTNGNFGDTPSNPDEGTGADSIEGFSPIATNDVNNDGTTDDFGVRGHDDVLPPATTVSFTYTVPVKDTLAADTNIENSVQIIGDNNDDGNTTDSGEDITSNITNDLVPQTYGVSADDTETGLSLGVNDGGDDDDNTGSNGDIQTVDTAASGELVLFDNIITNNGNGTDSFELSVATSGATQFPSGTIFTFYQAGGNNPLLDTNGDGNIDTGPLGSGNSITIVVKAQLPAGAHDGTDGAPYEADLTAESAGDSTQTDTVQEKLDAITAPGVDLANGVADNDSGVNNDEYTVGGTTPTQTETVVPGAIAEFTLSIQNDSGVADSFQFSAGSTWDGTTLGALPADWTAVFYDSSNNVITTSPAIPAGHDYDLSIRVFVPSNPVLALADFISNIDGVGGDETVDGNGDSDGDYPIFIRVQSVNTGASDIKLDAVDVTDTEDISLITNHTGQIQPGGSIGYDHTLRNDGNTDEEFLLTGSNSLSGSGWGNSVLVDTTNNGIPDKPFSALETGDDVYYLDAQGSSASQSFTAGGYIDLLPGQQLPIRALVFAPSSAPDGTLDTMTLTATYNSGGAVETNVNQTTVILGQLRLVKTAAIDVGCDGTADEAFATDASTDAKPQECVIWRIVITNEGTADADQVIVTDTIPAYTDYVADSMESGAGNAGTTATPGVSLDTNTDADDDEGSSHDDGYFAEKDGNDLIFYVGTSATQTQGGTMAPGASISLQFRCIIQ